MNMAGTSGPSASRKERTLEVVVARLQNILSKETLLIGTLGEISTACFGDRPQKAIGDRDAPSISGYLDAFMDLTERIEQAQLYVQSQIEELRTFL